MANTYHKLRYHIIFSVKNRTGLISSSFEKRLHSYIAGILTKNQCRVIEINGISDHIHILVDIPPKLSVSQIVQLVKSKSTKWINDNDLTTGKFEWQTGFGAFSVSIKGSAIVEKYIQNQKRHHRKKSFVEEYEDVLENHNVEFDSKYTFDRPT